MYFQYKNRLSFCLIFLWPTASLSCHRDAMQVCHYHEELMRPSYSILFTQSFTEFQNKCRQQKTFLGCAFMEEQARGCSYRDLLDVVALNNTHHAVCGDNMTAYNRSRPCLLQLESNVSRCYRTYRRVKDKHCVALMAVRECIQKVVLQKPACSPGDVRFVGKVFDSDLKPYAHREVHKCDKAIFGDGDSETTTQAEQKSSTTDADLQNTTLSTGLLTETRTSSYAANISTKVVHGTKKSNEIPALASRGKNSSNRLFLSAAAMSFMILAWLSKRVSDVQ